MGKKIIVIDDDEGILKTFFLLFKATYRVYLAKNAEDALERFKSVSFDLIIVDYKLPRMNGLEMISRFRELGYEGPVILISAYPEAIRREDLKKYAINQLFLKPLDLEALESSIHNLLGTPAVKGQAMAYEIKK
ncbi:MAG: response regulator [Candidatus Aminicenantes bacterium]|nr:response regulator [Candidatus Aminicenantes bacterium]